jgi:hypothetical protein
MNNAVAINARIFNSITSFFLFFFTITRDVIPWRGKGGIPVNSRGGLAF